MPNFTAGTSFTDGVTNDVTAAKLNALVADAVPTSSLALTSTNGTIANFTSSTANITLGTIPTLTAGTTTGTAGIFTSGTIATLNSTTGTIPTIVATTLITTGTGTAAAPAIVPTGDSNTGIFFPAADTIAFSEGGAEAVRIDSSGNVGIGTASPDASYRMTVSGSRSAVVPGIIFTDSDATPTNYSLYINGNKSFTIFDATAGANRLLVDSSGNVGIGTTSPSGPLHIRGAAGRFAFPATSGATQSNGLTLRLNDASDDNAILDIGGNSTSGYWLQVTNNANLATNYPLLLNPNGGNVGIGVTSPVVKLDVSGGNIQGKEILLENGAASSPGLGTTPSWYSPASGVAALSTNATERLRIDSSGNLLVGCTASPSSSVSGILLQNPINSASSFSLGTYTGGATVISFINGNGAVGSISVSGSATAYNTSSDYRLKTNLEPISNGIERVKQLPVYRFNWIADQSGNKVDGFVAHEAKQIIPECVSGEKDAVDADGNPIYQGIDQSKIVPLLTAALKEAIAKIETLEAKVTALEAE